MLHLYCQLSTGRVRGEMDLWWKRVGFSLLIIYIYIYIYIYILFIYLFIRLLMKHASMLHYGAEGARGKENGEGCTCAREAEAKKQGHD